jgi:predicted nucleotidyltransferase
LIYGSIASGECDEYSDIDVFVINVGGLFQKLQNCFFNMQERIRALGNGVSLDIYCIENLSFLKWRIATGRKEKSFVVLSDPNNITHTLGVPLRKSLT